MSAPSFIKTKFTDFLLALSLIAAFSLGAADPPLRVAAAADLSAAFEEIGKEFAKRERAPVFTFGSTGLLTKQISQGAPYDVFAAANVSYIDELLKAGVGDPSTKALYARGRLVVWVPKGKEPPRDLKDLKSDRYVKIAIANPEHAPYGKAAVQALISAGIYDQVKPKLVFGENVRQTLQFGQSGNAEACIVSMSLTMGETSNSFEVPGGLFQPIDQALVVCSKRPEAKRFVQLVTSEVGRAILRRYGFFLPGEAPRP